MTKEDTKQKPLPPKRALAPFFLYKQEVYEAVKKEHPAKKITEYTSIIAKMWEKVDAKERQRFQEAFEANRVKYQEVKDEYEKQYGKIGKKQSKKQALKQALKNNNNSK